MKPLEIAFTDREITPWAGLILLRKMLDRMGFERELSRLNLPAQGSNRGYPPQQLLLNFIVGVWSGASRFEHLEVTRQDKVLQQIFGWKRAAGHRSFMRYFEKFSQPLNQDVFGQLYRWFFKNLHFDNYTLDFDSTVMTRYGLQQGARKGYNPAKKGRNSHHPILAFVSDLRMVANVWLRRGDCAAANNFIGFFEDTLTKLNGKKAGLVRADSGFFDQKIFKFLENHCEKGIPYIIAARFITPIKRLLIAKQTWMRLDEGLEIAETTYQAKDWEIPRRIIMVRQNIKLRPNAAGKQLHLFEDEVIYENYRFSCFVTNLELPANVVYDTYRARADAENRIKELKYDFGADSFNQHNFWATEASMYCVMLAYNLMSLFRQQVLGTKVQKTMKTLRYEVFGIGGHIVKDSGKRILKLSLAMKRREWFTGLWNKSKTFCWPIPAPA